MKSYYGFAGKNKVFFYIPEYIAFHMPKKNFFKDVRGFNFRSRLFSLVTKKVKDLNSKISKLEEKDWIIEEKEVSDDLLSYFSELYNAGDFNSIEFKQCFERIANPFFNELASLVAIYSNTEETGIGYYPPSEFDGVENED